MSTLPSLRPLVLLLGLAAASAEGERPFTEEELKRMYQPAACADPDGWVQVRYGNSYLEVRCNTRGRATAAPPAEKAKPRSADGYQETRWGMTKSEVRRLYPNLRGRRSVLYAPGRVAGYRATTSFHFRDNALFRVRVVFQPPGGERGEPECFERVRDALIEKYGPPQPDGGNTWELEETRIELSLDTASVINRLKAVYSQKGSAGEGEEEPAASGDGL